MDQQPVKERFGFKFEQRIKVVEEGKLCGWCGRVAAFGKNTVAVFLTDAPPSVRQATDRPPQAEATWLSPDQIKPVL